jgi:hypothetical protein
MSLQKEMFFSYVAETISENPEWMAPLIMHMQGALLRKLDTVNDMRVEAEFALMGIIDLVPKKKLEDNPAVAVKAKRVLSQCGSFAGTEYAKQLEQEITAGTLRISAQKEQQRADDIQNEKERVQRLRENRERERHKKHPVATITGESVARSVATGESFLKPYKVDSGVGAWSFHAWVLVVNEEAPSQPQERSMLYVGDGLRGRYTYADEKDANAAIEEIRNYGNSQLEKTE